MLYKSFSEKGFEEKGHIKIVDQRRRKGPDDDGRPVSARFSERKRRHPDRRRWKAVSRLRRRRGGEYVRPQRPAIREAAPETGRRSDPCLQLFLDRPADHARQAPRRPLVRRPGLFLQ